MVQEQGAVEEYHGTLLFDDRLRRLALLYGVAVAVIATAAGFALTGRDHYLLGWVLTAGPFTTPALWFTWKASLGAAGEYLAFWQRWFAGLVLFYVAGVLILVHLLTGSDTVGLVASGFGLMGLTLWGSAALAMLRSISGLRSTGVDVIEALMAIVIVSAPAVYGAVSPVLDSGETWLAVTFAVVAAVQAPTGIYLSIVNYARLPQGARATQGVALLLASVSAVNLSLQVAQILSGFAIAFPPLFLLQAVNMAMLLALPLYAHSDAPSGLERLPVERQVRRRSPMPLLAVVVLPPLAVVALARQEQQTWGPAFVVGVFIALLVLAGALAELTGRETRRLYAELEREAAQRRLLLDRMVAALEEDRHHVATELHTQAVESFAALGALVQTAYATLPPDTASAVKQAIGAIQDDLSSRVESLRRLMLAVRPPALAEHGLASSLEAYVSSALAGSRGPAVHIEVQEGLRLDWSTSTIAYRVVQLALDNVRDHARASTASVQVTSDGAAVIVEVTDDGVGLEPTTLVAGTGIDAMRLFAGLGRGTFDLRSRSGAGTSVRVVLGVLDEELLEQVTTATGQRLHVIKGDAPSTAASDDSGTKERGSTEHPPTAPSPSSPGARGGDLGRLFAIAPAPTPKPEPGPTTEDLRG